MKLENIKDIALLVAIYLYFTGWIYIYFYFDYFHLSFKDGNVEAYYFFIYSLNVLFFFMKHYIISLLVLSIGSAALVALKRRKKKVTIGKYWVFIALFPLLFIFSWIAGSES